MSTTAFRAPSAAGLGPRCDVTASAKRRSRGTSRGPNQIEGGPCAVTTATTTTTLRTVRVAVAGAAGVHFELRLLRRQHPREGDHAQLGQPIVGRAPAASPASGDARTAWARLFAAGGRHNAGAASP
eukprot:6379708-Prymnesium_polylepis.1